MRIPFDKMSSNDKIMIMKNANLHMTKKFDICVFLHCSYKFTGFFMYMG